MASITPAQRAILSSVCDAFQPADSGVDVARLLERVLGLVDSLPNAEDQERLAFLCSLLGNSFLNLALSGSFGSFDRLSRDARVNVLLSWAHSGIQLRRAGFQALKRLVNVAYYAWPVEGTTHPMWSEVGYPGPLPPLTTPPLAQKLTTQTFIADSTIDCDVVIVGSGAGGGVAAGVLAEAGKSVVVLEMGANLGPQDCTQIEGEMLSSAYLDGGLLMTQSGSLPILAGSCVGGGTTVNWTSSFPLRDTTAAEWDRLSGLALFGSARFAESIARVTSRSGVNTECSSPGVRDQIMERGLRAMSWHVDVIPRNVTGCPNGRECGYCGFGCRSGAKNGTAKTYLADAVRAGARVVAGCEAQRILKSGGRASGVEALVRTADGQRVSLTVRAKTVIAAAGALNTPSLLHRSGLTNPLIGRGLRLHPVTALMGTFDERVEPWTGHLQTRHSDQFADQHDGYGAKLETGPIHWALPGSAFGWEGPSKHRADIRRLGNTSVCGILLRDRESGHIETARDGRPRVHYELSRYDAAHLRAAMIGASDVLAAAGAREIFTLQQPPARINPGAGGWRERFAAAVDASGLDRCRMALISFHQMASCAMGADPRRGVVGETGESFELPGLYVADASAFVAASGVNPMITIMALADHVARGIADVS